MGQKVTISNWKYKDNRQWFCKIKFTMLLGCQNCYNWESDLYSCLEVSKCSKSILNYILESNYKGEVIVHMLINLVV